MATKPPKEVTKTVGAQNDDGSATEAIRGKFIPKRIKVLTLPLLKIKANDTVFVKFTDKIFTGKQIGEDLAIIEENKKLIAEGKAPKPVKSPPEMANVINLETGELVQIMLGHVLCGIMHEEYPNHGYVNKGFEITAGEQKKAKGGGNYNTYTVAEIEV